jgi:predicted RNase H-like HicB family nuclease
MGYTAKYTKLGRGKYMGQLLEWPEVITEGRDLEDCRESIRDALKQMILAYRQHGRQPPHEECFFEQITVEM